MAQPGKVLIVDSKTTRRHFLENMLFELGHRSGDVIATGRTEAAGQLLGSGKFHCVFIFSGDSRLDWLGFINFIRSHHSYNALPVIVLSLAPTKESVISAYEAGANGVLAYPCSMNDLESVMKLIQ